MGHVTHAIAYVHVSQWAIGSEPDGYPDVEAFRATIPDKYRHLLIGPVETPVNGGEQWVFLSSGSKDGWEDAKVVDRLQTEFLTLFSWAYSDGSSPYSRLRVLQGEATYNLHIDVETEYGVKRLSTSRKKLTKESQDA